MKLAKSHSKTCKGVLEVFFFRQILKVVTVRRRLTVCKIEEYAIQQQIGRAEKAVKRVEEEMRRQQERNVERKEEVVASDSSLLAASSSAMNLDFNDAANDDPDPLLKDGEQAQVHAEIVTVKKKEELVTLDARTKKT